MRSEQQNSPSSGSGFASWYSDAPASAVTASAGADLRRIWPDAVAFREAIQSPSGVLADADMQQAAVAIDRLGMPLAYSGRFAIVFRLTTLRGERWALRCFTSPGEDGRGAARAARYRVIAEHAKRLDNTFVPFRYIDRGIRIGTAWYPIVAMRWANGEPLGRWVESHLNDPVALHRLCGSLSGLLERLETAGIAHGDWQHDNLLISDDGAQVTVVDYDGMFVPEFEGLLAPELGHPNYQHPDRTTAHFGVGLDRFACLVIETALLALAREPSLWARFADGESMLFKKGDLSDPETSQVFRAVRETAIAHNDTELAETLSRLGDACRAGALSTLLPSIAAAPAPESLFAEEDARLAAAAARGERVRTVATPTVPVTVSGGQWWQIPENAAALAATAGGNVRVAGQLNGITSAAGMASHRTAAAGNEYLARLQAPETQREEWWHLWRWRAGVLGLNTFVLTMLYYWYHGGYHPLMFFWVLNFAGMGYGHWPRKRIREAIVAEIGKMENLIADRQTRIAAKSASLPANEDEYVADYLRRTRIAQIVSIDVVHVATMRVLGEAGIENMWEFRERLAQATPQAALGEQMAALQKWCADLENEARVEYQKTYPTLRTVPVEVERLQHELAEFERHVAALKRERDQFPESGFGAYLRKLSGLDGNAAPPPPPAAVSGGAASRP